MEEDKKEENDENGEESDNEEDENEPSEVPAVSYKLSYMHRSNYDGATQGLSSE